jgi:phytanoyl-CoA hydroxylase
MFVNELYDDSRARDEIRRFCLRDSIRDMARSLAGDNVAHCCYQFVYKYSKYDKPFAWHQDEINTPANPMFYNMWIALNEMDVDNGCLWALPQISLDRVLPHAESPFGLSGWSLDDPNQGVPLRMRRGDICLMGSKTMHKSSPNISERSRKAMLIIFMDRDAVIAGRTVPTTPYP